MKRTIVYILPYLYTFETKHCFVLIVEKHLRSYDIYQEATKVRSPFEEWGAFMTGGDTWANRMS